MAHTKGYCLKESVNATATNATTAAAIDTTSSANITTLAAHDERGTFDRLDIKDLDMRLGLLFGAVYAHLKATCSHAQVERCRWLPNSRRTA